MDIRLPRTSLSTLRAPLLRIFVLPKQDISSMRVLLKLFQKYSVWDGCLKKRNWLDICCSYDTTPYLPSFQFSDRTHLSRSGLLAASQSSTPGSEVIKRKNIWYLQNAVLLIPNPSEEIMHLPRNCVVPPDRRATWTRNQRLGGPQTSDIFSHSYPKFNLSCLLLYIHQPCPVTCHIFFWGYQYPFVSTVMEWGRLSSQLRSWLLGNSRCVGDLQAIRHGIRFCYGLFFQTWALNLSRSR
jgi:hypothetical protein